MATTWWNEPYEFRIRGVKLNTVRTHPYTKVGCAAAVMLLVAIITVATCPPAGRTSAVNENDLKWSQIGSRA